MRASAAGLVGRTLGDQPTIRLLALSSVGYAVVACVYAVSSMWGRVAGGSEQWRDLPRQPLIVLGVAFIMSVISSPLRRFGWVVLLGTGAAALFLIGQLGLIGTWLPQAFVGVDFATVDARPTALSVRGVMPAAVCSLVTDGRVWCWGDNSRGQLGDGTRVSRQVPAPVPSLSAASALMFVGDTPCAITAGRLRCWGDGAGSLTAIEPEGLQGLVSVTQAISVPVLSTTAGYVEGWCAVADEVVWCSDQPLLAPPQALECGASGRCDFAQAWPDPSPMTPTVDAATYSGVLGSRPSMPPGSSERVVGRAPVAGVDRALSISGGVAPYVGADAMCAATAPVGTDGEAGLTCWGAAAYKAFRRSIPLDPGAAFVVARNEAFPSPYPIDPWLLCPAGFDDPRTCPPQIRRLLPSGLPSPVTWVGSLPADDTGFERLEASTCAIAGGGFWCWDSPAAGGAGLSSHSVLPTRKDDGAEPIHAVAVPPVGTSSADRTVCFAIGSRVTCVRGSAQAGSVPLVPAGTAASSLLALVGGAIVAIMFALALACLAGVRQYRRTGRADDGGDGRLLLRRPLTLLAIRTSLATGVAWLSIVWLNDGAGVPMLCVLLAGVLVSLALPIGGRGRCKCVRVASALAGTVLWIGAVAIVLAPLLTSSIDPRMIGLSMGDIAEDSAAAVMAVIPGVVVLLLPPLNPAYASAFRTQWSIARSPRARLGVVMHPIHLVESSAAESERTRLAAELHAEVLPGLYRSLREVERSGSVERLAVDLEEAVREVEDMLARRRSIVLEEMGLLPALEWLAERTEERSDLTVTIDVVNGTEPGARAPRPVERAAFRIAGLAIDNAARHAPGAQAIVSLLACPSRVEMSVTDDGPGMADSATDAAGRGRRGLADMAADAEGVGGSLDVGSADPGADKPGTRVVFTWPR